MDLGRCGALLCYEYIKYVRRPWRTTSSKPTESSSSSTRSASSVGSSSAIGVDIIDRTAVVLFVVCHPAIPFLIFLFYRTFPCLVPFIVRLISFCTYSSPLSVCHFGVPYIPRPLLLICFRRAYTKWLPHYRQQLQC